MKTFRLLITAGLFFMGTALTAQENATKTIECYCTDSSGERVELGQTICMEVDGRTFAARCEMALNNPFWRETEGNCLSS